MLRETGHRAWTGDGGEPQDGAAEAGADEKLDGGSDPSLQALHRGLSRACRRGLRRGRGAEGRVRRLSCRRRHQSPLSLQDQGAWLRAFAGHGFPLPRPYAGRCLRSVRIDRYRVRGGRSLGAVRRLEEGEMNRVINVLQAWSVAGAVALLLSLALPAIAAPADKDSAPPAKGAAPEASEPKDSDKS